MVSVPFLPPAVTRCLMLQQPHHQNHRRAFSHNCYAGWQVRLCVGERNVKGNPIATPYGAGNTMYHRLLQQLAELQLQDVLSMPRLLSLSASRMTQETVLLITPYTDRRVARWKQQSGGLVLVTGHAHDSGNCADAVVPAPEYLRNGEAAL